MNVVVYIFTVNISTILIVAQNRFIGCYDSIIAFNVEIIAQYYPIRPSNHHHLPPTVLC